MRLVAGSRVSLLSTCIVLLVVTASTALAQAAAPAAKPFKEDELAALLAPIALYPDTVIAQILMASTYPMEVVEAHRYVEANKSMQAEALAAEVAKKGWDASVQGLVAVPEVLKMMNEKLDWTQKVGDAFLAQQKEVIAMVQTLRAQAMEAGNLKSDDHMKVTTEPAPAEAAEPQVIVIESADPQTVYVPTYSPVSVYGSWGYPAYPPYYWPPPMGYPGSGFWWGMGVGIAIGGAWGGSWGNDVDWNGGDINIGEINVGGGDRNRVNTGDRNRNSNNRSNQKWSHNPEHRKGASYRDGATASKYDRGGNKAGASSRDSYRGRDSASAGTRDASGGSRAGSTPSAGTSNRGSSASAGSRDLGPTPSTANRGSSTSSGSRGGSSSSYGGSSSSSRPSSSTRSSGSSSSRGSSSAFGGMSSGSRASSYGSRGGASRGGGGGGRRR